MTSTAFTHYAALLRGLATSPARAQPAWGDFSPPSASPTHLLWNPRPADGAGLMRSAYCGLRIVHARILGWDTSTCHAPLRDRLRVHLSRPLSTAMKDANDLMQAAWDAAAFAPVPANSHLPDHPLGLAAEVITRITDAQKPSGAFFDFRKEDNAESWWFCELVTLHAIARWWSCAEPSSRASVRKAVTAAAQFHLHETQPDHATMHPWGLSAMILHPPATPLADWLIGAMQVQFAGGLDAVSTVLLLETSDLLSNAQP